MKYKRLLALMLGFALLAVACGGDEDTTPDTQAPTTQATQQTEAPATTQAMADEPDDAMMDADSIADIRSRIEGQSVVVGSSGFPNASLTGAFRTMDFLRDDFGLDVEFRLLDSDPLVAATIAGEVEVGQLSLAGMANAVSAGSDFVAFGGDDQKNSFIIAAKAPVSSMEELRGQPVAATQSLNQITGQTLQKCLADAGMTVDDVQLVRLAHTGEATQAISSGQVVGGISATWRLTQLTLNEGPGAYNMLCAGWEAAPQISSVWYAERAWVEANPDIALAFNIASLKSARWAQEDKQRWIDYALSKIERLTPEAGSLDYDSLLGDLDMWPVNGSLDRDLLQTTLDTSLEFEAVDRAYTVDELVTFEFQDKALEILGVAERNPDIGPMADDAMMDADAMIADIRSRIEGQSVVVGSSGFPNASLTGAFRTMDFLRDDFGLDVEFRLLDSDPLVAATIAGEVEVGQLSLAGMANAVSAGSDFVAFGGDDQKNSFIIAAKAPVSSMEELRGHPVAATQSLNQITGQTLQKCLADVGMTVDDVQLVRLAHTGEATQAITSGQVVGGISATWRLTQLTLNEGEGAYNMLCAGWESNPQISSVWYAERAWVEANPDLALAFNLASLKSARWALEDKDRWIEYALSKIERLTPEAAAIDYDGLIHELDMWPVNGSLDHDLMQTTLDTSLEFEAVDRAYTVDELVTFEFQDKALEILGRM
ncbi:ABC transporter substrate-binding protein [Candidatus Spongiisocius sp.]|uniref:ABC transporter substrate-binding protein n=1 Tax=Candidatus Spongiisocius sp. TaxID=3101273 RepID=UPI003B59825D